MDRARRASQQDLVRVVALLGLTKEALVEIGDPRSDDLVRQLEQALREAESQLRSLEKEDHAY